MKTYEHVTVVCLAFGLLNGAASYGLESAEKIGLYRKAQTDAAKLFDLGQRYADGATVARNDEEAVYYYNQAASLGNARAQLSLGLMYAEGRGVQKDFDAATRWMREAAACAQLSLRDAVVARAESWLRDAAAHGYSPARRTLGAIEDNGKWGDDNAGKAAAEPGKPSAFAEA